MATGRKKKEEEEIDALLEAAKKDIEKVAKFEERGMKESLRKLERKMERKMHRKKPRS